MAKPFSALPQILDERKSQFLRGAERLARRAARDAGLAAVRSTRVDTGLARSNWRATIGAPSATVVPPYAPGMKLGIGEQGNAIGAATQQRSVIDSWKPNNGAVLYIANNVPYIGILNFGGPHVGPGNMLAQARQAWVISIKTAPRILK